MKNKTQIARHLVEVIKGILVVREDN
jgi:hypothetical protein